MIGSHAGGEGLRLATAHRRLRPDRPTISHHLKVLRTAGLIDGERRGTWSTTGSSPRR
ncbi:ArsR family transcriptional regulator [Nonomuraea dietziae]|uniref:ArsR family transcriptional regulator n=1 Tax=Nonomuraea dietziae TaxID=65515 RepID=UPI0031D45FED